MGADRTHILVLNYNGRSLLAECLPSLVEAARRAPVACAVTVVDNGSADGSLDYLASSWPEVAVVREPNRGLSSFNHVLARLEEPVVLLLNNDVKLDADAVGPLLDVFEERDDALFSAPLCWTFDGDEYEGLRTRVRSRFGMVQGMCRVPGFEETLASPDLTAAAGPVLAVDRLRFLELGGFDPMYFPGRIEDLDLGFRGWMRGWKGYYVPQSIAYHRGFGSFAPAFGPDGCDHLAARNTLLFAWKNLSGLRFLGHLAWLAPRLLRSVVFGKPGFAGALREAVALLGRAIEGRRLQGVGRGGWTSRQEAFFRRFRW